MSEAGSHHQQRLLLIRHPETIANVERRYIGRTDSPLTDRGRRQVTYLSDVTRAWGPDAIYSSPLGRAWTTAVAIAPRHVEPVACDDLVEIDFGQAEGHTWDELVAAGITPDYASEGPVVPGGENVAALRERVRRVAAEIERGPARTAVVTHGGVLRLLLVHWLGLPRDAGWRIRLPNAVTVVLRFDGGAVTLEERRPPGG